MFFIIFFPHIKKKSLLTSRNIKRQYIYLFYSNFKIQSAIVCKRICMPGLFSMRIFFLTHCLTCRKRKKRKNAKKNRLFFEFKPLLTKVWRPNHCQKWQGLICLIIPKALDMKCPAWLFIFTQEDSVILSFLT